MTKEEAYRYIDNLKWLKGYDNTTIGGKTVGTILDEIKAMLKEQEPKQVIDIADSVEGMEVGYCPSCNKTIANKKIDETKFCRFCGQEVKWE